MAKKKAVEAYKKGVAGVKTVYKYGVAFSGKKVGVTVG